MPTIAEMLIASGLETSKNAPDLVRAGESGARMGAQLAETIQNAQNRREELELKKQQLDIMKNDKIVDIIQTGLTKVPKKAQAAYFKNFARNQAGQLGVNLTDEFINGLTSPDINQGLLGKQLIDFRSEFRHALESGDFTKANEAAAMLESTFGGDVSNFGDFLKENMNSELSAYAQQRAAGQKAGKQNIDNEMKLRDELSKHKITQKTQEMSDFYRNIVGASKVKNAASDVSLIYGYMKMQDPGSTVRETEYASAQNAAGVPERVRNAYNNALKGTILDDKQRNQFANEARRMYSNQYTKQQKLNSEYIKIARASGVNPDRILPGALVEPPEKKAVDPLAIKAFVNQEGGDRTARIKKVAESLEISTEEVEKILGSK